MTVPGPDAALDGDDRRRGPRAGAREAARRQAAVLLTLTSLVWVHEWTPVIFVLGFVAWVLLHRRLQGDLGRRLAARWRRIWPPPVAVLVLLLIAGTAAYCAVDLPLTSKVLPIAVNLLALSMVALGSWWRRGRRRAPATGAI